MTTVTATNPATRCTVIRAKRSACLPDLPELWRFRDLLWRLAVRDVKVIYKQTLLGALWAVIRPVVSMVVFTVLMGRLLGIERMTDPVYVFAGLVPWSFFAAYVAASTNSLVANAALVQKVYFPRLILPLSSAGAPIVDFAMSMGVLVVLMAIYGVPIGLGLLWVVPLLLSTMIAALGVGVGLSAVTAHFRDVRHAIPFVIQTLFFLTPVMYPRTIVPAAYQWVYQLNPIAGPVEGFRAAITGGQVDLLAWAGSTAFGGLLLVVGVMSFGRAERRFADVV